MKCHFEGDLAHCLETSLEKLRFFPQDIPTVCTLIGFFCICFASRLKNNRCINGKSNLDNGINFPRLSTPPVPSGVTLPGGFGHLCSDADEESAQF